MNSYLSLENIGMSFSARGQTFQALTDVRLQVEKGEFISLIGHSGCGKSTVLNIVAGLLQATAGGVLLENKEVNSPGPDRAVVFQNHSLLPWLTVYEIVRLAVNKVFGGIKNKQECHEWTLEKLELVHMSHALEKRPNEISGGMKQRVGIARALAMEPKVLLMDEPYSALDAKIRQQMREELKRIQAQTNVTVVFVTHDQEEAMSLSDRIVVMEKGKIAQVDTPAEIYENPINRYTASFIGEMNFLPTHDGKVKAFRPEDMALSSSNGDYQGTVQEIMNAGHSSILYLAHGEQS